MLEIANTINFLGRTLPSDTDITDSVIELKVQFGQIDGAMIPAVASSVAATPPIPTGRAKWSVSLRPANSSRTAGST